MKLVFCLGPGAEPSLSPDLNKNVGYKAKSIQVPEHYICW